MATSPTLALDDAALDEIADHLIDFISRHHTHMSYDLWRIWTRNSVTLIAELMAAGNERRRQREAKCGS